MYLISRGREFQAEGAAYENERFPNVLVLTRGIRRVLESERERSQIKQCQIEQYQTEQSD